MFTPFIECVFLLASLCMYLRRRRTLFAPLFVGSAVSESSSAWSINCFLRYFCCYIAVKDKSMFVLMVDRYLKALVFLYAFEESVDCHLLSSFCDDSNLHISLFKYVLSTMGVSKESISKFLIGNRFHVKLRILSPENCKQRLQVKSWKAEVTAEKKQTQNYNRNFVIQVHKS